MSGYFSKTFNCWLIVQDGATHDRAKHFFRDQNINITIKDHSLFDIFNGSENVNSSYIQENNKTGSRLVSLEIRRLRIVFKFDWMEDF